MYENILFPVDDSEDSSEILHHVGELANWADATIHLLFVADTTRDSVTVVENTVVDALVQEGEGIVEDASKTLSTLGVEYETDVVQGNPAPTIVEYADRYGHDLIAMSTHGRRGVSRYLQGSVSEKVVRLSSVPVLTARMQPDEQLVFPYENVLITTDGSAGATRAAQHGLALAESLGATVHVLSVVDDASLSLDIRSTISGQEHEQAATEAAKEIIEDAETYGVTDTVQHIEQGDPADVILNCIDANDIHVVVMGTTGRRGTDRILLGSVAEKTVRSAPVPVLTIGGVE
ncbi:universal stress protein [Haloferax volcanii]|uniref:UspA domain protein n=4 Tax=Haloferax TaxID=2251 RepID=A0A384K8M6_HALVD|nr:universal stress protein [Haloferax volcanii]ADE01872.1 UspA domain protein [Haloferax volcanii DS2]ELY28664.1 uspA domain protein [Haloferax volcanii DS2]MBS8120970.1 universal stress protein [Haloferax volcanii]MBS8126007.1 universal stress protein [Haloferax volcanii]MBS8129860.1 universal stress protein [Haloferax volcanii]